MSRHVTPKPPMKMPGVGMALSLLTIGLAGPAVALAEPTVEALNSAPPPPVAAPDTERPT